MKELKIVTDWEGPWVLNDFAYEVCSELFSPRFFEVLSSYDDYLAYEVKKENYNPGDTLRLIAPFLVAKGVTSEWLREFSSPIYVRDASPAAKILGLFGFRVVVASTAYKQFLDVSCRNLGFSDYYGTDFQPEKYEMSGEEREFLLSSVEKIEKLTEDKFDWLDRFFWEELSAYDCSRRIMNDVRVMGGERKAEVARGCDVAIGDSISDMQMLESLKDRLSIAFNGNRFAIESANLAVVSRSALATLIPILVYAEMGVEGVRELSGMEVESVEARYYWLPDMSDEEVREVISASESMRRSVRGDAGKLG